MKGLVQLVNMIAAIWWCRASVGFPRHTQLATYAADGWNKSNGNSEGWRGFWLQTQGQWQYGKEKSPSVQESLLRKLKEIQASVTIFNIRWHSSMGSTAIIQQGRSKGKPFINQRGQSDGARLQECRLQIRYTTTKLSTMRPLRPLRSTAKSFHQATPNPDAHMYTHTEKNLGTQWHTLKQRCCPTHREHP